MIHDLQSIEYETPDKMDMTQRISKKVTSRMIINLVSLSSWLNRHQMYMSSYIADLRMFDSNIV
jgi:hypothetical protein